MGVDGGVPYSGNAQDASPWVLRAARLPADGG